MATIKVLGYPLSTATRLVLCCLEEKQVDYELVVVDAAAGAHKQPQYLALNPFGLVPTIQDGDLTLFESRAIVKYLAKKYKGQGTELFGNSLSEEALVEQWCEVEGQSYNSPPSLPRVRRPIDCHHGNSIVCLGRLRRPRSDA